MSFTNSNISWSINQVVRMYKKDKIDLHHPIQRGDVWEKWRRQLLVDSLFIGFPIPVIYAKKKTDEEGNQIYVIMEGVQRIRTFIKLLNDELPVTISESAIPYIKSFLEEKDVDLTQIKNVKFSELPNSLKEHLKTVMVSFKCFDDLTPEEEVILFKRLNMGKPLSSKSKFIASITDLDGMCEIGSHPLFEEMLSEKALGTKSQVMIVAKIWMMLFMDINDIKFDLRYLTSLFADKVISNEERQVIDGILDLMKTTHQVLTDSDEKDIAKKLYTETHMVSLVPVFKKAIDRGITNEDLSTWLMDFFGKQNDEYEMATSGSSKNTKIIARNEILNESFEEFFKDWEPNGAEPEIAAANETDLNEAE